MPVGMSGGCGVGGGLAVLAGDVGAVRVPAWVAVLLAVAGAAPVAAVCLRERVLGPALCVLRAAEAAAPWVLAVSGCRELLVAIVAPVGTPGLLPCLVEDAEGAVVFLTAAVPEGTAVPGLSVGAVDSSPAPAWPAAGAAWSCSVVCSVVLWLTAVV